MNGPAANRIRSGTAWQTWSFRFLSELHHNSPRLRCAPVKQTPASVLTSAGVLGNHPYRDELFLSPNVPAERHIRQMRVVVLRSDTSGKRFQEVVFVIRIVLIAEIPIEVPVDHDRQARLGRIKGHWIRSNQRAAAVRGHGRRTARWYYPSGDGRSADGIREPVALAAVLVQTI